MNILSRIVFDATDEPAFTAEFKAELLPHLHATRSDRIEVRNIAQIVDDVTGETQDMSYIIVYSGNIVGLIADLTEAGII